MTGTEKQETRSKSLDSRHQTLDPTRGRKGKRDAEMRTRFGKNGELRNSPRTRNPNRRAGLCGLALRPGENLKELSREE